MCSEQEKHIIQIRKEKYWLDEDGHLKGENPLASDLRDSIEHLAEGLYSKNAHFIFELIQNAEDNAYIETDPSLSFRLVKTDPSGTHGADGALIVVNNEIGFSPSNAKAICSVGRNGSTKHDKVQGYIGEKGIGFKSVFRITTTPYIVSNGYRFCLPEKDEETGLGYIVPRWIENLPDGIDQYKTNIILPLDKQDFGYEKIEKMLQDIEPETILFLSKLKEIKISTETGHEITVIKNDSALPLVEILVSKNQKNPDVHEFLLDTKSFLKPSNINPENRQGIKERNVSVAFPLNEDNESSGKIFAYLPVRSDTGLPFLINADFLLTSDREDIIPTELWNEWLRNCIFEVFVEAFEKWLERDEYRTKLYGFIPIEAHTDFLKPVVESIHNTLKEREIILTEPDGQKCKPEYARTASKKFRSLLSDKTYPNSLLETRLVLSEIEAYKDQLYKIGVKQLNSDQIKQCFQDQQWIEQHDYDWLLECYRYLSTQKYEDLSDCPIVPIRTDDGVKWSCDDEQPIYFERDEKSKQLLDDVPASVHVPLAFLDQNFYEKVKNEEKINDWMTKVLRVYDFSDSNYAVDVLQRLKEHYKEIRDADLVTVTVFLSQFANTGIDFKNIPILLADGRRMLLSEAKVLPGIQAVVTPEALDPETGWQNIFVTEDDRQHLAILSNQYIISDSKHEPINRIKSELGVIATPLPFCEPSGNYKRPSLLRESSKGITTDFAQHLVIFLKRIGNTSWGYKKAQNKTDFLTALQEQSWLPTTKGLKCPSQAFLPETHIKEVLGDSVPYFEGDLPDNIIKLLGIRTEATAEELVSTLEQLSRNKEGSKDFAEKVYRYLNSIHIGENILNRIKKGNFIFVSIKLYNPWVCCNDVIWKDRSDVLGDDFIYLEKIYPDLKDFFVNKIKVKQDVDTECFAQRWLKLQEENSNDSKEIEKILLAIYREIRPICLQNPRPSWLEDFITKAKIWTQSETFENPKTVYVPDDGELKKIFPRKVSFAWRPDNDSFSDWELLYKVLELPYLSESVGTELPDDVKHTIKTESEFLTDSAKILIATYLYEKHREDYQRLQKNKRLESLRNTREALTSSLKVTYFLNEHEEVILQNCFWDYKYPDKILFIAKESSGERSKNSIARTIARDLMPNRTYKDLADWIELVLGSAEDSLKLRIDQKGWHIPSEIKEWMKKQNESEREQIDPTSQDNIDPTGISETFEEITPDSPKSNSRLTSSPKNSTDTDNTAQRAKAELLSSKPIPNNTSSPVKNPLDYQSELKKAFNRSGATILKNTSENDDGIARNPDRRRKREAEEHERRRSEEPDPAERRRKTERAILESPDEIVRSTLGEWYGGRCQICGETFPERNGGNPFFIANYIVKREMSRQNDNYANALCLCADHFAKWQHGSVEADNIFEQIKSLKPKSEGGDGNLKITMKLCGEECQITFNEKHLLALQEVLKIYEE